MIATVGTALYDLYMQSEAESFEREAQYVYETHIISAGGKATNQAAAICRLGGSSLLLAKIGNDEFGNFIINSLNNDNVDTSFIAKDSHNPTGFVVLLPRENDSLSLIVSYGASRRLSSIDFEHAMAKLKECSVLIIGLEIESELVFDITSYAKHEGLNILIDPYPPEKADTSLLLLADVITPNRDEAEAITGRSIESVFSAKLAARDLISAGVNGVCLKLGSEGIIVGTKDKVKHINPVRIDPVDATAGGDVFVAALALSLEKRWNLFDSACFANYASALTVTKQGSYSSIPYLTEVIEFMKGRHCDERLLKKTLTLINKK